MNRKGEEAAGNIWTEEMNTGIENEGEHGTEDGKHICSGTSIIATYAYMMTMGQVKLGRREVK